MMSHDRSSARLDLHSEHFGRARLAGHILYFSSFPFVGLHAGRLGKHERFSPFHQGLTSPSLSRYKKAYGCPGGFCSSETFFSLHYYYNSQTTLLLTLASCSPKLPFSLQSSLHASAPCRLLLRRSGTLRSPLLPLAPSGPPARRKR